MGGLRWVGRGTLVLVGLMAVTIGGVYAQSERVIEAKAAAPARKAPVVAK